MMIQTLQGNFIQYRMICAININNNYIVASLTCGEHHDLYVSDDMITYEQNEQLNKYLSIRNITDQYVMQRDILHLMSTTFK